MESFGDELTDLIYDTRGNLFTQGEIAQLTYISYEKFIQLIKDEKLDKIPVVCPVGFKPDGNIINSTREYTKDQLIERYQYLSLNKLPVDGIFKLVTIIETLLNDILRTILVQFPNKIPSKRKMDVDIALKAKSLDEIKFSIIDHLLNELSYKSPKEYAEEFEKYTGLKLFENPIFHKYIELKATRDIHIHNNGIANEIYRTKAATLARVKSGYYLPVDILYFLQSYECCIQLTEILEEELDQIWPSQAYRIRKSSQNKSVERDKSIEKAIEESKQPDK